LINLLNNALKFTQDGVVELNVKKDSEEKNKVKIKFTVSDTGMGISEKELENVFKVYEQGDPEITRKFGGSGLGLAISNSLCEKMGGRINVNSKVGEGTNFWFSLPFEMKAPEQQPKPQEDKKIHILVVEDNLLNQGVVGTTLQRNGFTFEVAQNGEVAYEKFVASNLNLIIMDIQMPVMDGYESTKLIRAYEQEHPERKRTKIVALTANATNEDKNKCREVGMDDYMTKPFRFKELTEIINRMAE